MIKRLFAMAAIFLFLFAAYSRYSYAELYNPDLAIANALAGGYYTQESNGKSINYVPVSTLTNYQVGNNYFGALVYGSPQDVPGNDYRNGQYRYLGYTKYGDKYTNIGFPPDSYANGAYLDGQEWIPEPWKNGATGITEPNPYDGSMEYYQNIKNGIYMYYQGGTNINGYNVAGEAVYPNFWDNIVQYVHILAPSTQYAWGIGRMWHRDESGNLWYLTVPLMPTELLSGGSQPTPKYPDYAITNATINSTNIEIGKTCNISFNVSQIDPQFADYKTVSLKADRDGYQFYSGNLSIRNTDGQKTVTIPWTCPGGISSSLITLKVNGGKVPGDSNHAIAENERYTNNEQILNITVGGGGETPEEPQPSQYNISGTSIRYNDGKTTADFDSTFTMPGTAVIRFYVQNSSGSLELKDSAIHSFSAQGSVSAKFDYTTTNTIVAAVNCYYSGGSWVPEKYHGNDHIDRLETTYSDNVLRITPTRPPSREYHGENSVKVTVKVVEERVTYETVDVYGWKMVGSINNPPKFRTRLVPNPGEPGGPVPWYY
ncbi:hypothetical protein L9W92_01560 [Pelotomaculum terephthalicicum JT]|uniref:Athe_2463 domain-containing protein n=1 Tax=Pelotomaculum TaxID=191373 RepID=UPI0009CB68C6|nr:MULTISPECIES: hypothetical protein [Pelotomaculum]MCG9966744.1 hypothetical protein [Pelotomaculum terephthalicicum JT]OPX85568.1 MAG: hypothetical protein A4E54_02377 [Pelotomaculum sp. PtaB.Bin117]